MKEHPRTHLVNPKLQFMFVWGTLPDLMKFST